jgi:transposase
MNYAAEIAKSSLDPALAGWMLSRLEQHESTLSDLDTYKTELQRTSTELKSTSRILKNAEIKIEALTLELAHLKRIRFGAKSEMMDKLQLDLFKESMEIDLAAIEVELKQVTSAAPKTEAKPTGRRPLPENLPRIEYRHEPESCNCGKCGNTLVKIGEDITEQLDVEPARFFVNRHIRSKYACRQCETMTVAVIPPAVIDGGMASPGLLAWVVTQKYLDHLPLYRIEQISKRHGVELARSTLAEWVGHVGVALQPLVDRMIQMLHQRKVLHADETPVPLLDPGNGRTRKAYLWAYRNNTLDEGPPIIVFDFQASRAGEHVRSFLSGWQGHLMVDDYGGYKSLFKGDVTELACWAHARRKFFDLHAANQHPVAEEALRRIGELYAIESEARQFAPEQRAVLRKELAAPRLEAMHKWLLLTRDKTADGSGLAKAIDYSLKRWPALIRYAESGNLPVDNNPIENVIRPIAIGKKNWMFTGSERAGKRAAAIQSLFATAKANGLEPMAWLKDTLEKLPAWQNSRIDELLPFQKNQVL